ncbi:M20/M25/M40 family metallo-hydrolase [Spirosoma endophyticum]|uniref:Acetylornithine deacetylase/Succinyl-diaminopimelate desuccinylase n=1 Tax=Spirosoma endophyticum TaxID=662367 RepID=A0A1I2EFP2_9BACT|nr:M20/M25/M40 family metallo-hydrolase [Spirosoma endophyticum]SFE91762.1 Acetylornithine deacetylase/Succinyl-diaminopimelate desuccinylase [Spirosoma endophyticum]
MNQFIKVALVAPLLIGGTAHQLFAQEEGADEATKNVTLDKKYETEINALSKRPAVQTAFKYFTELEPQTKKDLILLTEIPSPPFKEVERSKKYAAMMKEAGADSVWIDKVNNVLAKRKGKSGKKTVIVEAHLDTVFPAGTDVKVKQKGDTLYAPGVGDDTRGLTAVLAVLKGMERAKIETDADVIFVGAVGEEGLGDLRGVKNLFMPGGPKIDSYIAVDGHGIDGITHRGLGSHRYRITFKGPGGHSYGAFGIVNPHGALGKAIYYFTTEADKFTKEGVKTTYSVSVVGGGTSVNAIPYESWMEVDMRSESPEKLNGVDALLQAAVQRALKEENAIKRRGPDLTVTVKLVGDRPSGRIEPTVPLVQRAMAVSKYLQAEPVLSVGSTNANIPISKGVPSVTIGSGGTGGGAHSLNEWWLNDKGTLGLQRILLVLLAEAGPAN